MGKVKEFEALLNDISGNLDELRENLRELTAALTEEKPEQPKKVKEEPKKTTIEEVRAVLSKKVAAEVRQLLKDFGVSKLSEITPDAYETLLRMAADLTDKEAQ